MLAKEIKSLDAKVGGLDYSGKIIKLAKPKVWKDVVFYSILTADKDKNTLKITFVKAKGEKPPVIESDFGKSIAVANGEVRTKDTEEGMDVFLLVDLTKDGSFKLSEPSKVETTGVAEKPNKGAIKPPETTVNEEQLLKRKIEFWHNIWKTGGYKDEGIPFEVFKDIAISSFIQESNYERDLRKADYYHSQRLQQIKFQEDYKKKLQAYPYNKVSSGGYKKSNYSNAKIGKLVCSSCKEKITKKESSFSLKKFKKELCFDCQKEQ